VYVCVCVYACVCVCVRFQMLFRVKEKWTLEELIPYVGYLSIAAWIAVSLISLSLHSFDIALTCTYKHCYAIFVHCIIASSSARKNAKINGAEIIS